MALTDDQKKEMTDLFSSAVADGLKKFRSEVEEERAKANQNPTPQPPKEPTDNDKHGSGFSLAGFILGE